ncbi:hypothetical protein Tfer_1429 [Thermincola ferriacetica]|uniref:RNA-binding protein KhpB N-terminal domain-containing protein n=1 Tax=Thermincola ferriacetica TaxID=281456 RepID=A0A0L6W405_9FIRM|nr:FapA family protein [Thermincola ferriacetica]KNZ69819.1 hypothetical protein Tfer_1429 [Thermincola ferriacetica]
MPGQSSILVTGKTVKEAQTKALKLLNAREDETVTEILSEGRRGFLGLGAVPAKVRVSLKEEVLKERELEGILADLDIGAATHDRNGRYEPNRSGQEWGENGSTGLKSGDIVERETGKPPQTDSKDIQVGLAGIKEGRFFVINPSGDQYAVVKPGEHIRLIVNGNEVEGESIISEEDEIKIDLLHEEPQSDLELKISPDKLAAYLRLATKPGVKYKLKDQPAAPRLTLLTEVEEILELPPPTPEEVRKFLENQEVVKGIIDDAIQEVIENPNSKESFLVAQGQRPVDGVHAYVIYPFLEKSKNNERGSLFENDKLVSVKKGDIVALKVPMQEGKDGWAVTGEVIQARSPVDCQINVRKGCEVTEDGMRAVATIDGRPYLETSGQVTYVSVDPIYVVQEVNAATGNIKFVGDIEVKGDVTDGCLIEADGNVEVFGDVSQATIRAGASIVVHKSVFGSTLIAGGRAALYTSILPNLAEIRDILENMHFTGEQSKDYLAVGPAGDGAVIQFLVDSFYRELPKKVQWLSDIITRASLSVSEEISRVVDTLRRNFCGLNASRIKDFTYLKELQSAVEKAMDYIEQYSKKAEFIKAKYVQNSSLMSSGDVVIEGQGCYISNINAGGRVDICGEPGVARGIKVVAGSEINVVDIGSDFDSQTLLKIKEKGRITAELINADVVVQIGREKYRVDKPSRKFTAYLNPEGRLTVNKLLADGNCSNQ